MPSITLAMRTLLLFLGWSICLSIYGQTKDSILYQIIDAVSSERLQNDVERLVGFGTRHTLSDTISDTRGIGAARRWVKAEFEKISDACHDCLDVFYQKNFYTTQ
ncbi:MAG: peptidase M28, partial [Flavobacteriaceae bacterium]|nr:peptidase M28 [Flavobacteriaceae bacterium]